MWSTFVYFLEGELSTEYWKFPLLTSLFALYKISVIQQYIWLLLGYLGQRKQNIEQWINATVL